MTNHTIITGPKTLPTAPVPRFCSLKRPVRMTSEMGTIHAVSLGSTSVTPSTAEITEIAGVIIESP